MDFHYKQKISAKFARFCFALARATQSPKYENNSGKAFVWETHGGWHLAKVNVGEWTCFVSNILVGVKFFFLLNCPLVLSLLKSMGVRYFWTNKMFNPNRGSFLNSSMDIE